MVIGYLDISNWTGISIGAVHWYGKLQIDHLGKREDERIELLQPMSQKRIRTLNREHGFAMYQKGNTTHQFDTEQEVVDFGIQTFKSGYKGVLMRGSIGSFTPWHNIIVWPLAFTPLVTEMTEIAKQFQAINGYEGPNKKLAERLDKKWFRRYTSLVNLCKD